jgi:hypothetical protein
MIVGAGEGALRLVGCIKSFDEGLKHHDQSLDDTRGSVKIHSSVLVEYSSACTGSSRLPIKCPLLIANGTEQSATS